MPYTKSLWPTFGGSGATLPSHGAVLLVFVSAHTQEGPFHIFTEGFSTHATEQLTFVHVCKREHRSSQTCASLLTVLFYQLCQGWSYSAKTGGSPVNTPPHLLFWGTGFLKVGLCALVSMKEPWKHKAKDPNSSSDLKKHPRIALPASYAPSVSFSLPWLFDITRA